MAFNSQFNKLATLFSRTQLACAISCLCAWGGLLSSAPSYAGSAAAANKIATPAPAATAAGSQAPGAITGARLEAQTGGISSYRLPNGFKIILAPYPKASTTRVELLVKTGSKLEGYGETGMAHLLEHMLFKGAGNRASIKSDLTALGAHWNGTTTADRTNYFEVISAEPEKIDAVLRIEADRFIRANFTQADLKSEMTVVRNELERNDSNPESLITRALQHESFFWHGYTRPTIGARSDIEDAPFALLQAFHKKHYRPDNAALIVSGQFDVQRVLKLATELFSQAKNPAAPPITSWTRDESNAKTNRSELFLPIGRTVVSSGWKMPGSLDRQTYALDLASAAICSNNWGSLRKELVLQNKVAVNVYCGVNLMKDYALFTAFGSADKSVPGETLSKALYQHIQKAATQGVSAAQLDRARNEERSAYERLENSHEDLAAQLSDAEVHGDWRLYFWTRDLINSITIDEANAALRKWLVSVNRNDVLLHDAENITAPQLPKTAGDVAPLLADKTWPSVVKEGDAIPTSISELANATQKISLPGAVPAEGALISRKTQGDQVWVVFANDYGNAQALKDKGPACHMANALMGYGGAGLSRDELSAKLEQLNAQWQVGLEGFSLEVPRKNLSAAFDLLLKAWSAPTLPTDEFDRIKAGTLTNIERAMKDPAIVASQLTRLRFDNYPAGDPQKPLPLDQQLKESQGVTYAMAQACVKEFLGLSHVRLTTVGNIKADDVQALWKKIEQTPKSKVPYARLPEPDAPTKVNTDSIMVSMPEKPNASVGGVAIVAIRDDDADFPALRIAIKALGGDANSRIWKRLREKEGLAYGAGISLNGHHFAKRSSIIMSASAASDKAEVALKSLQEELAHALKEGFSDAEIESTKHNWLEERKNAMRDETQYANALASGLLDGRDYAWLEQYDARIAKVTAAQASSALRKYLGTAPIVWSIGKGDSKK